MLDTNRHNFESLIPFYEEFFPNIKNIILKNSLFSKKSKIHCILKIKLSCVNDIHTYIQLKCTKFKIIQKRYKK